MIIQNMLGPSQASLPEARVAGDTAPSAPRSVSTETPSTTATASAAEPTPAKLRQAVEDINRAMQPANSNLQFSIDPGTQRVIVKIVDAETGDVIRQLPPKVVLAIAAQIDQELAGKKGLLLSQTA
jgi:flagellar protein FlaG